MRAWLAFLAILPACGFKSSPNSPDDAGVDGDPPDAAVVEFGTFVKVRLAMSDVPTMPRSWNADINIDTDGEMCEPNNDQKAAYCVIAATDITLGMNATLTARGSKPIVLLATGTLELRGTIDVSSRRDRAPGAGARPASACQDTAAAGHSGGFGGSFHGMGGNGGIPVNPLLETGGVAAAAVPFPIMLQGGCAGGSGSKPAGVGGAGGTGGGAVAIVARTLRIGGKINASGSGGRGGPSDAVDSSGGGGGGSGGMIVVDASTIMPIAGTIWLYANGGGGGQGGTAGTGGKSGAGDDGKESLGPTAAAQPGSNGSRDGGTGGDGSSGSFQVNGGAALADAGGMGGGGAGGGGAGFIRSPAIDGAEFAPDRTNP